MYNVKEERLYIYIIYIDAIYIYNNNGRGEYAVHHVYVESEFYAILYTEI